MLPEDLPTLLSGMDSLERLDLRQTEVTDADLGALAGLPKLTPNPTRARLTTVILRACMVFLVGSVRRLPAGVSLFIGRRAGWSSPIIHNCHNCSQPFAKVKLARLRRRRDLAPTAGLPRANSSNI